MPNTDVSRDVVYGQAQISGWSPTNFQDNSYLGVGPSSNIQQRSDASLVQRNKGKQPHHPIVAPSKRMAPPASDNVRAARPYSKPASRYSARTEWTSNVASSSTRPRLSNREEVNFSASSLSTVEEAVRHPTTSLPQGPSSDSPTHIPYVNAPQMPRYLDTQSYYPVAPSKRMPPPANNTMRAAAQPYTKPESRSLARTGGTRSVALSSTGLSRSNREEVDFSASSLSTVEEAVGHPTTSLPQEPSLDSSTHMPHVNAPQMPRYLDTQSYYPVAPSKRMPPPANNTVRAAAQPYTKPESRSLARTGETRNVASSSTGPRRSNREEVDLSVFIPPTVEEGTGCASPTTSVPHKPSSDPSTHPPQVGQGRRVSVPLRPWRSTRVVKRPPATELQTIEFWTEDKATGKITPGTYFADRFKVNSESNRSLVDPDQLPLPGKVQKGFNIRILVSFALFLTHVSELTLGIG